MASPFPTPDPDATTEEEEDRLETRMVLHTLQGYIDEAEDARRQGAAPRDEVWERNWDAYWCLHDATGKQPWQANNVMPEVPQFVERFTAAITQALVQSGQWFTITDPADKLTKIMPLIEKFTKVLLDRSARNQTDHRIGFEKPFGDAIKAGCMMMVAMSVTWRDGSLLIEPVDARELFFDPSGRNLYRIRRYEIDGYQLDEWAEQEDSDGNPLFDLDAIARLSGPGVDDGEIKLRKEKASGHGQEVRWQRKPVVIHEFLATILDLDGKAAGKKELVVMANEQEIIRGPEKNPYWHGRDWIVASPLITVPFSVYGRTYVESFRMLADSFVEFTNLIHDAVFTNSMNAFMGYPDKLADATQLNDGVSPNKVFIADEDAEPGEPFLVPVALGNPQAVRDGVSVWTGLKQELREGGWQNELNLGQLPPKGDITATEIMKSDEGSTALTAHIAGNTEDYLLAPIVELAWMTGLQMLDPEDPELAGELGPEITGMLTAQKEDFRTRRFRYKAKGLSGMLARSRKVRDLLNFLTVAASNEVLMKVFMERFSGGKVMDMLMRNFGIDPNELEKTEEERVRDAAEAAQQQGLTGGGAPGAAPRGSPPAPKLPQGGPV